MENTRCYKHRQSYCRRAGSVVKSWDPQLCGPGSIPPESQHFSKCVYIPLSQRLPEVFPLWRLNSTMDLVYVLYVLCDVNVSPAQIVVLTRLPLSGMSVPGRKMLKEKKRLQDLYKKLGCILFISSYFIYSNDLKLFLL